MKIQLFPEHFLECDNCFELIVAGKDEAPDLSVTMEEEAGVHFYNIHSTPDHLAYLTGLNVPQAWTSSAVNFGVPPE